MDSGTHKFFAIGGLGALAAVYGMSRLNLRDIIDISKPGGYWKIVIFILALLNLKSLPFAWHYRLLKGLLSHVTLGSKCPPSPGPSALFQPLIISSRTSLWETDYNGHKSNSTYFADLDIARMHLITCLMKTGLHRAHYEEPTAEHEAKYGKSAGGGRLAVMLGGVSCHFRREIKPFQAYEIWTRVLCWDRKWLYLVSHIVKKGAVGPSGYSQQPERISKFSKQACVKDEMNGQQQSRNSNSIIFATSVAKYVFKSGRITIPPELVLTQSKLLPPNESISEDLSQSELVNTNRERSSRDRGAEVSKGFENGAALSSKTLSTWVEIELERCRGMALAEHFANLDKLDIEFTAEKTEALGEW